MKKHTIIKSLLILLMSMVSTNIFAYSDIEVENADGVTIYYMWINNKTELAVTYNGTLYNHNPSRYSGDINIPETVTYMGQTYSVTSIGEEAFVGSGITSITIPNSVTEISKRAFASCYSLTSITIPNSVTSIDEGAFYGCHHLTSITISNSVTSISRKTFATCSNLTSITIPNSVTSIGDEAFNTCSSLTSITIPNSVTSIGKEAFNSCSSLPSISIPNSVTSIGEKAFSLCSSLSSITIPNSVTSIGDYVFNYCSSLTSITIPNSVSSISRGAFYRCSALTSITISNSVTSISEKAFSGCSSLTSITIPNSVTSIGEEAFSECSSLTSITIQDGVKYIYDYAFQNCTSLNSITIPKSVKAIRPHTFAGCNSLESAIINCAEIDNSMFSNIKSFRNVVIGDDVRSIGFYAFKGCTNLTSITLSNSLTFIGANILDECTSLTSIYSKINPPFSLNQSPFTERDFKEVTLYVPIGTSSLYKEIRIWKDFVNIVEIDYGEETEHTEHTDEPDDGGGGTEVQTKKTIHVATAGTLSSYISESEKYQITDLTLTGEINGADLGFLREMAGRTTFTKENNYWRDRDSHNTDGILSILDISGTKIIAGGKIGEFETIDNSGDIVLNESNVIPRTLFCDCRFSEIRLPESLSKIEAYAFCGCKNLKKVTIPNNVSSIEYHVFDGCVNLKTIESKMQNPYDISTDNFDEDIYKTAELIVPPGTKSAYQSKEGWKNFQKIHESSGGSSEDVRKFESGGIKYIINDNGTSVAVTAGNSKYKGSISIPSSVSYNGKNYDVTSIGYCAFGDCTGLTSISIPNSVMFIQYGAFQNCSGLTSITLPNSIQSIAQYAFMGCSSLKTIESEIQNPFVIEANTFGEDTYKTAELIVPQGTKSAYESTAGWSLFANITSPSSSDVVVEDNVVYEIEAGTVAVVHADDVSGDVTIEASVVINGETYDVTIIAEEAFRDCAEMTSVEIPNSITIIGEKAFNGCSGLRVIKIGKGILEIAKKAFANIFTSAGTRGEDDGLHFYCDAELVPATSAEAFEGTDIAHATLHVPDNLVETYKVVTPWNGFGTIVGLTETGIIDVSDDLSDVQIFDMQGNRIDKPRKGLNIIRTNDGKAKKVVMR